PTCFLLLESLRKLGEAFGKGHVLALRTADGQRMVGFTDLARRLADRLIRIFQTDANGRRPVHGDTRKFQEDPHWRDHLLFYEHFHGDNGAGLGASHQTGWTGIIARMLHLFATTTAEQVRELGKLAAIVEAEPPPTEVARVEATP